MLETEDVDEDYFTPLASTTLANIFQNQSNSNEEDASLKYVPPKPSVSKPENSKTSDCIFACALFCYEWHNNVYTPKGKVGFAIMKMLKSGQCNILLYDLNKVTLSCTTIQPSLNIKLKGETYISFYDNAQKYWSLCGSAEEIKKLIETLKILKVEVLQSPNEEKPQPNPKPVESTIKTLIKEEKEQSDTDSSVNRRTKASILSRMASMGHSILPPQALATDRTSDSSDTNDTFDHHKVLRHKPTKNVQKKTQDKSPSDLSKYITESHKAANDLHIEGNSEEMSYLSLPNKQLLPMPNTIISTLNSANDMAVLMSEQRMNNSELRMNMGRISDKVDQILDKVNDLKHKENVTKSNSFQNEIFQKLLKEYERKINIYEEFISSKGFCIHDTNIKTNAKESARDEVDSELKDIEIERLKKEIFGLQTVKKSNEQEISSLTDEIKLLKIKLKEEESTSKNINKSLIVKMEELDQEKENKNEYLEKYQTAQNELLQIKNLNKATELAPTENKIKDIMNDTFQSIAANFNNEDAYSGAVVKNIVATVIKKVTLEILKET